MAIIKSTTVTAHNNQGGKGDMYIEKLLTPNELKDKCGMYACVTIPVGSSLGVHYHHGNGESYHILKGTARYNDNGTDITLHPGDTAFCYDVEKHGIENIGDEDLVFIALIVNK